MERFYDRPSLHEQQQQYRKYYRGIILDEDKLKHLHKFKSTFKCFAMFVRRLVFGLSREEALFPHL